MVECEYSLVKSGSETVASFNRYMVECELKEVFNTITDVALF